MNTYQTLNDPLVLKYMQVHKFIGTVLTKAVADGYLSTNQMKTLIKLYAKIDGINSDTQAVLFECMDELSDEYYRQSMETVLHVHKLGEKAAMNFFERNQINQTRKAYTKVVYEFEHEWCLNDFENGRCVHFEHWSNGYTFVEYITGDGRELLHKYVPPLPSLPSELINKILRFNIHDCADLIRNENTFYYGRFGKFPKHYFANFKKDHKFCVRHQGYVENSFCNRMIHFQKVQRRSDGATVMGYVCENECNCIKRVEKRMRNNAELFDEKNTEIKKLEMKVEMLQKCNDENYEQFKELRKRCQAWRQMALETMNEKLKLQSEINEKDEILVKRPRRKNRKIRPIFVESDDEYETCDEN